MPERPRLESVEGTRSGLLRVRWSDGVESLIDEFIANATARGKLTLIDQGGLVKNARLERVTDCLCFVAESAGKTGDDYIPGKEAGRSEDIAYIPSAILRSYLERYQRAE